MRQVQIVVLSAIFAVLSVIAWQLVEIRRELVPFAALTYGAELALTRPPETREQRNERLRRQQQRLDEDMNVLLSTPATAKRTPTPK